MELRQQTQSVDLQRDRVHEALEAVRRHVVAAADRQPTPGIVSGHRHQRAHDLPEHRSQIRAGIFRVVDLGAQARLANGKSTGQGRRRHPDVDAEPRNVGRPVRLLEVVADQVAAHAEVAADGLADAMSIQRPRHGVRDGVGDRAVVLVPAVERGDEVVAALEDWAGKQFDPLRHDGPQI